MKNSIKVALTATSVAVALLLSGCAGAGNSVQASESRDAHLPGSRLCVFNNSSMNVRILWRGYPDTRPIPPAGRSCNSGYEAIDDNLAATLEFEPLASPGTWVKLKLTVDNSWPSAPHINVWYFSANKRFGVELYSRTTGETAWMQKSGLRADVLRVADSDSSKEWELSLTSAPGDDFFPWLPRATYSD